MKRLINKLSYSAATLLTLHQATLSHTPPFTKKINRLWNWLSRNLIESKELQVWTSRDRNGTRAWHAYDPIEGQSTHNLSENELRIWIEQRH